MDRFRRHREASVAGRRDADGQHCSKEMVARSLRAEVAAALSLPNRTVETLFARARILVEELPATLSGLRAGRFSERHAVIIADESIGLSGAERMVFEEDVLPYAERMRAGLFKRKARRLRELVHGADLAERHEEARAGGRSGSTAVGMGWGG